MEILVSQFLVGLIVFVRIISLVATAPLFGAQTVPLPVKAALAGILTLILLPVVHASTVSIPTDLVSLVVIVLKEALVGLLMGFMASLVFNAARFAGDIVSTEMGFSLATVFEPESGAQLPVLAEFLSLVMLMVFLLLNGHHMMIEALQMSYTSIPIGGLVLSSSVYNAMMSATIALFVLAVKFAAPVLVAMVLTNIALAILARMMPQMNIFAVAFPLKIGIGLIVLVAAAPLFILVFKMAWDLFQHNLVQLVRVM